MASFQKPKIYDNPEGWGPAMTIPEKFSDIPYAPFNKGDRLGKASDWTGRLERYRFHRQGAPNAAFGYYANEEEDSFQLVDNKLPQKPKQYGRRFQPNVNKSIRKEREREREQLENKTTRQAKKRDNRYFQYRDWEREKNQKNREASVEVKPDWELLEQISFVNLSKCATTEVTEPADLLTAGKLHYYNKDYDRVSTKFEKKLGRFDSKKFYNITTTDDPVIRHLVGEGVGQVYATDSILACLAASARSVFSWDVVVSRVGSKLFFDKRDQKFDYLSVNETVHDSQQVDEKEPINQQSSLALEATCINQNFSQQVLDFAGEPISMENENPFASEDDDVASGAYRYRKWKIGEHDVVARCELNGAIKVADNQTNTMRDAYVTVRALNEYDPRISGVDWRRKLDTQRGAVLATELKNNSNKLARWTTQAILAGTEQIKIGYVSRVHPRESFNHVILGTQFYRPTEFASQINLVVKNMWGVIKFYVDLCMKLPEGKYVLLKDPNKPVVNLYEVPLDSFDDGEDEDEDDGAIAEEEDEE